MRVWPRVSLRQFSVCLVVLGLGLLSSTRERASAQEASQRWDGLFEMISARYDYTPPWPTPPQPANAISRASRHAISRDGQYVVFTSETTNWGYSAPAIYRRDRRTGQTELLFPYASQHVAVSGDGQHVVFDVCDPWMRPDNLPICDAWALDLRTYSWAPLSTTVDGTFGDDTSGDAVLSHDGRFAVFTSKAANLTGGPAGVRQVMLRDRDTDGNGVYDEPGTVALEKITVAGPGGSQLADADSESAEVSDDGRFVAFRSLASNLLPGDHNEVWDVFLRDRQMARTFRLSVRPGGQESHSSIDSPQIAMSADGRTVAFTSDDRLLAASSIDDTNNAPDVFVYDHQSRSLTRIDVGGTPAGQPILGNGPTSWPALSADGRYVSVESAATNVEVPPSVAGSRQVYVVDRLDNRVTRISVKTDGQDPDHDSSRPSISGDGSVVLFWSLASNLVNTAAPTVEQLFAAVHFAITPNDILVPTIGGDASYTVTTQQHTMWWAEWDYSQTWFGPTASAPYGIGNGTMDFTAREPNPDPIERTAVITVAQATATLRQNVGLSLTSISPTSGPMAGGTTMTLRGTGFEPGMFAWVGERVDTTFVDTTTLTLVTPPHDRRETVPVSVGTSDGRYAWLDQSFTFTDSTPPLVMGWATGTLGQNEWFVGDVTVTWGYYDPDSEVTTSCPTVQVTTDTAGTTYTCSVTSEGGTGSAEVHVKRDATPPSIAVATPAPLQLLELYSDVNADYTCTDAISGVTSCSGAIPSGSPLDTTSPGWKTFSVGATDAAGNAAPHSVEYAVSNGACTAPGQGLEAWMRFNGNLNDAMNGPNTINTGMPPDTYVDGKSGQAYNFVSRGGQSLEHWHYGRLNFDSAMSVAMWLKPGTATHGTLVKHKDQYRLERTSSGAISWTLLHPTSGPSFGTSTAKAPMNAWSHVVFTYNAGEVRVYVNGRLDRTWSQSAATLQPSFWSRIRIGGPDEWGGWPYVGAFDELQFFNRAIGEGEVEQIFLAGASGLCAPVQTMLEVPSITTTYGAGTYPAVAVLRDANGTPLPGKTLQLEQRAFNVAGQQLASTTMVTDATGTVRWDAPFDVNAGTYPIGFTAHFAGDLEHAPSEWVTAALVVAKATPQLTWATPAAITYGTALSHAGQLNATADVAGSFTYAPGAGSVPHAGTRALSVNFVPSDYQNYEVTSATVDLEVAKAQPSVTIAGGTFSYDGQPHGATASATDFRGVALTPVTITYDGSPNPPIAAGVYTAVATYAGDADHEPRSVTATVTINKATASVVFSGPLTVTYDGQPHGVTASLHGVGGTVVATLPVTYDGASEVPVNAGLYTASAAFEGDANYQPTSASATVRINPSTPAVVVGGGPFTYDAQPHGATVSVTGVGGQVLEVAAVFTYDGAADLPVNAGSYAVSASVGASGNYAAATASGTLVITKATPVVTVGEATFTYGSGPFAAPVTVTGIGGEVLGGASVTYNGSTAPPFNAGAYDVVASYAGSANYAAATGNGSLTVMKAAPIFVVAGGTATYDGQPHPAGVILAGSYGETLQHSALTYNGLPDAPVNAGVYAVEARYDGAANYEAATVTGTLTIEKATVVLSVTGGTFTYDAQPHAATVSATGAPGEAVGPVVVTYNGATDVPTNGGTYAVVASFAGSANYTPATRSATLRISPAALSIAVTGGTFTYDGQAHPATVTATGISGEPVTPVVVTYWRDGFGWFDAPMTAGTYDVAATFQGSANYLPKTEHATIVIGRATPSLTWAAPASIVYGTALGSAQLSATTSVPGTFSYSPAAGTRLGAGAAHMLTATFVPADPANYAIGSVSTTIAVTPAPLVVQASDVVKRFGAPLPVFTATFAGLVNGESPSVLAGALAFGTTATQTSPVGAYPIVVSGVSSPNYAIAFVNGALTVVKGSVAVALSPTPTPSGFDMPVRFTATVAAAAPAAGSPSGTIRFFDGDTLLAAVPTADGTAVLTTAGLDAGVHSIEARYDGDAAFEPGTGSSALTVNTAAFTPALSVTSSRNPSNTGQNVTFNATITMPSGPVTGSVAFYDGELLLGTAAISAGHATLSMSNLPAGSHPITARYLGGAVPAAYSPVLVQAVGGPGWKDRASALTLAASAPTIVLGDEVVFTVTVSGSSSSTPSGRVLFMIDGAVVGDPEGVVLTDVGSTAQATLSVPGLAHGRHNVTATYLGDPMYKGSTARVTQIVD